MGLLLLLAVWIPGREGRGGEKGGRLSGVASARSSILGVCSSLLLGVLGEPRPPLDEAGNKGRAAGTLVVVVGGIAAPFSVERQSDQQTRGRQ